MKCNLHPGTYRLDFFLTAFIAGDTGFGLFACCFAYQFEGRPATDMNLSGCWLNMGHSGVVTASAINTPSMYVFIINLNDPLKNPRRNPIAEKMVTIHWAMTSERRCPTKSMIYAVSVAALGKLKLYRAHHNTGKCLGLACW
mmetsp:Transcript_21599/g.41203  ORF Transcript_21599/g.41203 Transcript_21599/m.41203 type:complete len:142 (+) Transcript_21599:431-856(+)